MIDTIFYFPSSLTFEEYTSQLQSGDISERTIVFADEQKSIYKGGKKYGGWSTQEFHEKMTEYENYDDSWINDELNGIKQDILDSIGRIDNLNDLIDGINNRLDDDVNGIGKDIQDKVEEMFGDSDWIEEHFPQGVVDWDEGWNDQIEAYLRLVGYWDIDQQGNKTTKWSKLQQAIDSLTLSVNDLTTNGTISAALSASIQALINDKIAELNLGTTYAKVEDVDDVHNVIEWLYSGLKSSAGPDKTFAQLVSAGKSSLVSAISELRTSVDLLNAVAGADLTAKVNNVIATLLLQSTSESALAALAAKADANSDNISALLLGMTGSGATADIQTRVSNVFSGFISSSDLNTAKSEIYSAIGAYDPDSADPSSPDLISLASMKTAVDANTASINAITQNGTNTSGFVTTTGLGQAVAELFASSGNAASPTAKASVVALVKDNKSSLELNANDVNVDGYLNAGSATFRGNVEATEFTTGSSSEAGISVITGAFDETDPELNTNKAYFAYDQSQGAITMWFYQNGQWKRIDLSQCAVVDQTDFVSATFYTNIPGNIRTFDPNDYSPVTLYYNRTDGKYYETATTSSPVTGTYYKLTDYVDLANNFKTSAYSSSNTVNTGSMSDTFCTSATAHAGYIDKYVLSSGVKSSETDGCRAYLLYAVTYVSSNRTSATVQRIIAKRANDATSNYYVCLNGSVYHYPTSGQRTAYTATTLGDAVIAPINPTGYGRSFNFDIGSGSLDHTATVSYDIYS